MAGGRTYGGSFLASTLQNQGISPEAIQALMASATPTEFHGSRSMLSFKDARVRTSDQSFYLDMDDAGGDDYDDCLQQPEKKRRLTVEQVHLLEESFEAENKLEPERKVKLAKDLGLQPRQIAIWFQNRRARWKTKQLEKDYDALKLNYDQLKGNHENLLKETEKLKTEVQLLKDMLLQRGGQKCNSKSSANQNHAPPDQIDSDSGSDHEKKPDLPNTTNKQEEIYSADSVVFYTDTADDDDDDDDEKGCYAPKAKGNTSSFGLQVGEEHGMWFWPH